MKKTAVEWVVENAEDFFGGLIAPSIIEQAKAMEKEQIMDTFNNGYLNHSRNAEQYYNQTFKSE